MTHTTALIARYCLCLALVALGTSSFAGPAPGARGYLPNLPSLGVVVDALPFATLDRLGLDYGVSVRAVLPRSPAERARVRPGDIIITFDGRPVYSPGRLQWLVQRAGDARRIVLEVRRDAEVLSLDVPLERPALRPPPRAPRLGTVMPGIQRSYLGIQMQPLTEGLRRLFGAPPGAGVVIAQVVRDGPADQAGLVAGDVLVQMDRKNIRGTADVYRALAYFEPGDALDVVVIRDKERRRFTVTLGESASDIPYGIPDSDRPAPQEDWEQERLPPPGTPPPADEDEPLLPQHPPPAAPRGFEGSMEATGLAI